MGVIVIVSNQRRTAAVEGQGGITDKAGIGNGLYDPGGAAQVCILERVLRPVIVGQVGIAQHVHSQGNIAAYVTVAVHGLDVPGKANLASRDLHIAIGRVVIGDLNDIRAVNGHGNETNIANTVNDLQIPRGAGPAHIFQDFTAGVNIGDMRPLGCIEGQGNGAADRAAAIHRLNLPGAACPLC